mmetsp:Transcript_2609/g.3982  ORF Transcript_2609/g.3982 Transcript_2609/m.3982 type:complete len:112 (+) Transcript_2609:303-638(+)
MTDKTDKGKETKDAGQHRHQKRNWQKSKQQRPDYKLKKNKDPEEIPVLKYGPSNNFTRFKEALCKAALRDYGHLGTLVKTGEYFKPTDLILQTTIWQTTRMVLTRQLLWKM